jgi:uncharacterized membrane protein YgcG
MFNGLFQRGDMIKTSSLKNTFYKTVERVTADVNGRTKGLYTSKSFGWSIFFAVLAGLVMGLLPFIYAKLFIHASLNFIFGLAMLIPVVIVYVLMQAVMYNALKTSKKVFIAEIVGVCAFAIVFSLLYALFLPNALFAPVPLVLISLMCFACVIISVLMVCRTPEYTAQLGDIVGFRNFILYAEKDRLEALLEEEPNYFYDILPYAQVLNVTDKWEKKFAALTVQPPQWLVGGHAGFTDYLIISHAMHTASLRMTSNMVSKPSQAGKSGGFGGFGGGAGGGHGGGGFRGR